VTIIEVLAPDGVQRPLIVRERIAIERVNADCGALTPLGTSTYTSIGNGDFSVKLSNGIMSNDDLPIAALTNSKSNFPYPSI